MVLDVWTALGLASNIVQFVDFTSKLVSGSREIFNSRDGVSDRTRALQAIATDLSHLTGDLTISTSRGTTFVGEMLRGLAFECQNVAAELQKALSSLQTKDKTRWKSFLIALQEVWRRDEIARMTGRLDALQRELNTHLLKVLL